MSRRGKGPRSGWVMFLSVRGTLVSSTFQMTKTRTAAAMARRILLTLQQDPHRAVKLLDLSTSRAWTTWPDGTRRNLWRWLARHVGWHEVRRVHAMHVRAVSHRTVSSPLRRG